LVAAVAPVDPKAAALAGLEALKQRIASASQDQEEDNGEDE
jgi:hypothetical protein